MKGYLVACAALPLLFACTPKIGGNTQSSVSSQSAAAAQQTVQQAAQAFGLLGTWAPDCSQPASQENEHGAYSLNSDGSIDLTYDDGPDVQSNRYNWSQALMLDSGKLQMDGVFFGDNLAQHTVLEKNDAGQLRVFGNVDGSGKILVQNGAFPGGGEPPWMSKCS
jgi:hypothetical protein